MTKNFLSLIALILFLTEARSQQYNLFVTNLTCDKTQKELVLQGHEKIKDLLGKMRNEGTLITFASSQELQNEGVGLSYSVAAESEAKFKEVTSAWKRRAELSDVEFFRTFWKACPKRKDTLMNKIKVMYPLIKDFWAPVGVVDGIDELPDPKLDYNIVVDFTAIPTVGDSKTKMDSSAANWALSDIGRIYNLHIAAGIPKNKIHFVVAVHAFAARSFYTTEEYRKRYKIDNPNLAVIEELHKAGVKFLVCGQSLNWTGDKKEMLLPQVKVSLTAQTTLSSYQLKGYALKTMGND